MGSKEIEIINDTGYGMVNRSVMRAEGLSITAKAIYSYLASFAGNTGKAFPSIKLMEQELGISSKTFHKYKKELVDKGVIKIEQQKDNGKFAKNIYYLTPYGKSWTTTISDTKIIDYDKLHTNSNIPFNSNNISNSNNNTNKEKVHKNIESIVKKYNSIGLSKVHKITKTRRDKVKARIDEYGLDFILDTLEMIKDSDFLMGRSSDWKATFDWLFINEGNLLKVSEGNYKNTGGKRQPNYEVYRNKVDSEEDMEQARKDLEEMLKKKGISR